MALYDLAQHCDYREMKNEMIRDRLVVGIRDSSLSEKLQLDSSLTLETAKKAIRQREAVHEQQKVLKGNDKSTADCNLDAMQHRQQGNRHNRGQRREPHPHAGQRRPTNTRNGDKNTRSGEKCGRCGGYQHPRVKCPAKDELCHHCKVKGHFSAVCRNKNLSAVREDNPTDSAFLDTISNDDNRVWNSELLVDGEKAIFKIDTGAEVTAISKATWQSLGEPDLQSPSKLLYGPAKKPLKTTGHFTCNLSHKDRTSQQQIFVVDDLKTNLLGLPAITALHLVTRTDAVQTETFENKSWLQRFPVW